MGVISRAFQPLVQHETLPDGTPYRIRHIRPEDHRRLQAFHQRLSLESIYLRYQNYHRVLKNTEVDRLCTVDYNDRMAFVATSYQDGEEHIVGVVRYDRLDGDHPNRAKVAIVVEDAYQKRGLGTMLFKRLATYAQFHGIKRFVATFLLENSGFLKLLKHSGLSMSLTSYELGKLEACIHLDVTPCL